MAKNYALLPDAVTMYTQTEVRDLSKNLVTGDFTKEYKGMEKTGRRRRMTIAVLTFGIVLTAWLLMITVVREVQINRLRQEVDQLSVNIELITATVKSLHKKVSKLQVIDDITDIDQSVGDEEDPPSKVPRIRDEMQLDSLGKLGDVTVLENVDDLDDDEDDDNYDYEMENSGDYIGDYDRRPEKGKPILKVDYTFNLGKGKDEFSDLKRKINENPEDPDIALPLPAATEPADAADGRQKRNVFTDDASNVDHFAAPRTITKDERRKTKKFISSEESVKALHTVSRIARNSEDEFGAQRIPFIAAHFHGNTSHLSPEIHEQYRGNGLVRVSHGAAHDVWYPAPWTLASPHPRPTLTRGGHVHVHHTGVYLVYVQVYYLDTHDIISWVLHRTNPEIDGRETLLQCAQSSYSSEPMEKPNSCFSAAALLLKAGDRLAVRNTGGDRHSLMQPEKSFIGLVKLADSDEPNNEL